MYVSFGADLIVLAPCISSDIAKLNINSVIKSCTNHVREFDISSDQFLSKWHRRSITTNR